MPKIKHNERLSCGHANNLLIIQANGKRSKSGVCPKGCLNVTILEVSYIDPELSNIEVIEAIEES